MLGRRNKKPKLTPYEIGKDGSVEAFTEANQKAANHTIRRHFIDYYLGEADQKELRRGAIQAFHDGHPENIQTALLYPEDFIILEKEYGWELEDTRTAILSDLIKDSNDPAADIKRALEKIPAQERQGVLDDLLNAAVNGYYSKIYRKIMTDYTSETLTAALLKAGANANAILAVAIRNNRPEPFIKLLHENKADFNEALSALESRKADDKIIKRLKDYREKYTGQPADENVVRIRELERQLAEAREEITQLRQGQIAPNPSRTPLRMRQPQNS